MKAFSQKFIYPAFLAVRSARSSIEFGGREMGLYVGPFGIGGADLVCTFHTRYFIEPPSQDTFSDGFSRRLGELGQKETVYFEDAWSSRCCY
jgi:hypothetical protein